MLIRLEYQGRVIHETSSAAVTQEIVIGRSHTCTWAVPKDDAIVSSRHVILFKKGKSIILKDLGSSNGTYYKGKKIRSKKLAPFDRFGVGNCLLTVDPDAQTVERRHSELIVMTGKTRGQRKTLTPPVFTIGSDPASSLPFLDLLISRRHAEISVKEDGSCWVRDLGSKNGTSVNGMPLHDDKERLLKDCDRISISHVELEFRDGAVTRSNSQTWRKIIVLVLTVAVCVGGWWMWTLSQPSWSMFYREAQRLAEKEQFTAAAALLDKASNARGAAKNTFKIDGLRSSLVEWGHTLALWQSAKTAMSNGEWTQASRALSGLQSSKKEAWGWCVRAIDEKEAALKAKAWLDTLLNAMNVLQREDVKQEMLSEEVSKLQRECGDLQKQGVPYLDELKSAFEDNLKKMENTLVQSKDLERLLEKLVEDPPPYNDMLKAFRAATGVNNRQISVRASQILPALEALSACHDAMTNAWQKVAGLAVGPAWMDQVELPPREQCAVDPRVSQARSRLEEALGQYKKWAIELAAAFGSVEKLIGREDALPGCVRQLTDEASLSQALGCDSFNQALPRRSRKEPSGNYDQLLGVDEFYQHLAACPERPDSAFFTELPFQSSLSQSREVLDKINVFHAFIDEQRKTGHAFRSPAIDAQMKRLSAIKAQCDTLVKSLVERAEKGEGRTALIAGGVVMLLTEKSPVKISGVAVREWVAGEYKRQRAEILALRDEYGKASPERQIAIRAQILATGIPGDPVVRDMWAKRDAASHLK